MKKRYKILIGILSVLLVAGGAFFFYVSDYYKADTAVAAMVQPASYEVRDNLIIFSPLDESETGLIFYPGAKVDEAAYYPLMERISQSGITCVLVKMPFHMAVFGVNTADTVYTQLPHISNWYIGGHSLGGAMASSYAASHAEEIAGVVLLGAYIYGDVPVEKTLTIYGSNDTVLDRTKITYTENVIEIEGGNHAYFGNYGNQSGDGTASITQEEQQAQTAEAICAFISAAP